MTGPLFIKPRRKRILFWAALAVLNLAAGVVLASQVDRASELQSIMQWGRAWLVDGQNVYYLPESRTDYPPHAIVLLSPLGLLPGSVALPLWVLLNMGMIFLAPYLAARFFRPHDPLRGIVLPILMFLCWGGNRVLTHFSLLALTFAMAALVSADRKPLIGGVWLGLALIKPQVSLPVLFWALFTRRWSVFLMAFAVVAGGLALFCARADADPLFVLGRYAGILAANRTGDAMLVGASELRPLIGELVSDVSEVDAINGSIALGLLASICVAGVQEGKLRKRVLYAAPPLVACWSLLSFYHLTYGFIVLLPVLMLLALNDTERSRLRVGLFWVLQIGLMVDLPGLCRRTGLSTLALFSDILPHADRVFILLIFAGLVLLAWREVDGPGQG